VAVRPIVVSLWRLEPVLDGEGAATRDDRNRRRAGRVSSAAEPPNRHSFEIDWSAAGMQTSTARLPRHGRQILALAAITIVLVACAGGAASAPYPQDQGALGPAPAPTAAPSMGPSDVGDGTGSGEAPGPQPDLYIIKTGTLELQVADVDAAISGGAAAIAALGGYVSGSERSGDGDNVSATITYRIPSPRWEDALTALRHLGTKVVGERTQTQDVTGQVVDLAARITNLRATESALQSIMAKATKISDVLDVQAELTRVRGDIEQATGEKQHLQEQASYSTLTVHFGLKPQAAVVVSQQGFDPKSEVDRASATLIDILQGVATAGIWFAIVWLPILIVLGLLGGIAFFVVRRRPQSSPSGPPSAVALGSVTAPSTEATGLSSPAGEANPATPDDATPAETDRR
jgi:Domain of unknown function (DUF4349)